MSRKTRAKNPPPYFYQGPPLSKEEKEEQTDDPYDAEERENMLNEDEMTPAEEGFMRGREQEPSKKETRKNVISHDDTVSVELAKEDTEDS